MTKTFGNPSHSKIAVIGGGVAGSTIALRLAELGIDTTLIEKSDSLVSGPPICHLHAGGNLYREISDEQCVTLLRQSIDTMKVYSECVNRRPTVIALPIWDSHLANELLPRLKLLQREYQKLVDQDAVNAMLGHPDNYYRSYDRDTLETLAQQPTPKAPVSADDWMIPVAKHLDFSTIQFPIYLVQEYGLSAFRFSAACQLAMNQLKHCTLKLNHQVISLTKTPTAEAGWDICVVDAEQTTETFRFDYVVNACGFRSGEIDDMLDLKRERFVEFKSAYIARWANSEDFWPEIIFHGERGTPQGMAQLTPYPNGYFQIHGMTTAITLFDDGLATSDKRSAQPQLAPHHLHKIESNWEPNEIATRTHAAISHVAQFLPRFNSATLAGKPLFGAQQIPGNDPSLRTANISFNSDHYARAEIVKASSALAAADAVLQDLVDKTLVTSEGSELTTNHHYFPVTTSKFSSNDITALATKIAQDRQYPSALAQPMSNHSDNNVSNAEKSFTT